MASYPIVVDLSVSDDDDVNDSDSSNLPSIDSAVDQLLHPLLQSWSKEEVTALLLQHGGNVGEAYAGACQLSSDPENGDAVTAELRAAIVVAHEQEQNMKSAKRQKRSYSSITTASSSSSSSSSSASSSSSTTSSPAAVDDPRYAFYLLRSLCVGAGGNDCAVTLNDLVPLDPNNRIVQACVFNMMIDWPFLLEQVPALRDLRGDQLTVIHGANALQGEPPKGALLYVPPLPPYGSHHSKGMLIWRQNQETGELTLRLIITTANFIHSDVCVKTNGVWSVLLPEKGVAAASSSSSSSSPSSSSPPPPPPPLETDVIDYFDMYNVRHILCAAPSASRQATGHRAAEIIAATSGASQPGAQLRGGYYRACGAASELPLPWTKPCADFSIHNFDFSGVHGVRLVGSTPGPPPRDFRGGGSSSSSSSSSNGSSSSSSSSGGGSGGKGAGRSWTPASSDHGAHTGFEQLQRFGQMKLRKVLQELVEAGLLPPPPPKPQASSSSKFKSKSNMSTSIGGGGGGGGGSSSSSSSSAGGQRRVVCQGTSSYNLKPKTLYLQFADSLFGVDGSSDAELLKAYGSKAKEPSGGWQNALRGGSGSLEFVVPTREQVRCSTEGYAAGASMPLPSKNMDGQWIRPLYRRYAGQGALPGRDRTMPHIKTYCDYSLVRSDGHPDGQGGGGGDGPATSARINYFLLTSSNMSTQAWGTLQNVDKSSPQIAISSYELGVLFHNTISGQPLVHAGTTADGAAGRRLPIPYALPPQPYRALDEPWTTDGAWNHQHPAPDALGRRTHRGAHLYGKRATSRQELAKDPPPL